MKGRPGRPPIPTAGQIKAQQMTALLVTHLRALRIPPPEREVRVCPERMWRFDLAWLDVQLGVEIDGGLWGAGRHARGAGAEEDRRKIATATALGWTVMSVTPDMIRGRQRRVRVFEMPAAELVARTYDRLARERRLREDVRDLAGAAVGLAQEYERGLKREVLRAMTNDLTRRAENLDVPILTSWTGGGR